MASVRLTAEQDLPPVCARCGRPAADRVDRTFAWHPPWVGLFIFLGVLPGLFLMFYLTRRRRVELPMCDRHRGHWKNPGRFALIGVPACVAAIALGAIFLRNPVAVVTGVYLFFGVVIVVGVWHGKLIRPQRIDNDGIVLAGVSEEFADAAKKLRADDEPVREYDDEDRTRRPNRYDIDVDEE